jgi:hypothetical protein
MVKTGGISKIIDSDFQYEWYDNCKVGCTVMNSGLLLAGHHASCGLQEERQSDCQEAQNRDQDGIFV